MSDFTDASTPDSNNAPQQPVNPFRLVEEQLSKEATNAVRGVYGVVGVAAVILGVALLFWPVRVLSVMAVVLGIYFVVSGVIRIVSAIVGLGLPSGWRVLDILVGLLLAVGGVVILKNAVLSGAAVAVLVTMTVGLGWLIEGIMAIAESWRTPGSGWGVLYAVLSIIAGIVVLVSPFSSTAFLMLFSGIALVVMGISAVIRAFSFGRSAKAKKN
ncbi:HdeD family acid-resistance protein [Bifidobacterium tibiigranuli]|jgi:uncharacterized membrane protein HdeD (DUF308 family)|uniref:HdeD family acid-resistance protein n=1 Tax=Bifidobacterium tibiigranuli TaxID=2172043 RepID=A0A5N6S2I2_9BIFI|nr:DUF308 domain-containing protein [Bifidobacterium tibiigranuli]KAE8128126.1 HdeD family acid-resistance protein [Bifidobacterium tibiigranuli]KAE8128287.1 HdeD family acid-resistance protein [Bifidobacterium tibiigranuli]MCH3973962.1 DUF308 domain-containing protein [Bifidobacterium tibiigranuli]MCH4189824.1 DUF308 domain-containing protein [Bifidobacterium tibiigranuli]MCH4203952.1 DUF308 domain-containing protein [Bifidobacterium tibiigranuli]